VRRSLQVTVNAVLGLSAAALFGWFVSGPASPPARASIAVADSKPDSTTLPVSTVVTAPPTSPSSAPPTTAPPVTAPPTTRPPVHSTTTAVSRSIPPTTYRYPLYTVPVRTVPTTSTTSTTIAPIGNRIPVAPSTLPLTTKAQNAHVSPVFAALSGAGFFVALVIMGTRFVLSRPGRKRNRS
jgi:hypothetical protein